MKKTQIFVSAAILAASFLSSANAYASNWIHENGTTKYIQTDGSYATGWTWIDNDLDGYAACYYFDENGVLFHDFQDKIDGKWVNMNGEWVMDGVTQRKKISEPYVIPFGTEPYNPAQPLRNCLDAWDLRQDNPLPPEQRPRYCWYESSKSYAERRLSDNRFSMVQRMLTGEPLTETIGPADQIIYEWFVDWLNSFDFMNMTEEERYNEIVKVLHSITIDPEAKGTEMGLYWEDPFKPGKLEDVYAYRVLINKRADVRSVILTTEKLCKALGLLCETDILTYETWIRTGSKWHYIYYGKDDSKKAVASSEAGVETGWAADLYYEPFLYKMKQFEKKYGDSSELMKGYMENFAR